MRQLSGGRLIHFVFEYGIVVVLLVLVAVFSAASPAFFTAGTLMTILSQVSVVGIICVGMTYVMLTGGIDLSVGSVAGVASVAAAMLMVSGVPVWGAVALTLVIGAIVGLFNAFSSTTLRIPSLIGTLGMMTALRGVAYLVSDGVPVYGFNAEFKGLAQGSFLSIPYPALLLVAVFVVSAVVLARTKLGRYVSGVGGNEEASRLSGIPVGPVKYFVFGMSGVLSALAGLVLLARTNSGQPSAGVGYELDAITAVVLGGVLITGGKGRLWLVIVGVLIMGTLSTGMVMTNVNAYVQQLIKGLLLVAAVAFAQLSQRSRDRQRWTKRYQPTGKVA
jgi:ribose/xylose/arabinose/galactoside ABC-type transport system permease subunit